MPSEALIREPLAVLAVLLGVVYLSATLVDRYRWARKLSTVMLVLFGSAAASNVGLVPKSDPLYEGLIHFSVPFAVCLILFTVRLADLRRAGAAMLAAFALASVATAAGIVVAALCFDSFLVPILGDESWKLAGPYTGTYIGGSLNFFALWDGFELGRPDLFAAANAVDNVTLVVLFAFWTIVPATLGHRFVVSPRWGEALEPGTETGDSERPRLVATHLAALGFLAVLVMAISDWMHRVVVVPVAPSVPSILLVTTGALVVAQFGAVRRLQGAETFGTAAFWLFFAAVGAMIDLYQAVVLSPILFAYVLVVIVVHMTIVYGGGWLLGLDVGVVTMASTAAKAGPPLVPAIAEIGGWRHLVLPGMIVGLFGYAVGNYAGFAVAHLVRVLLGG